MPLSLINTLQHNFCPGLGVFAVCSRHIIKADFFFFPHLVSKTFLWNLFLFLPAENNFSQVLSEHKAPWCPGRPTEKQEGRQIVHLSYPLFNSLVPNVFWITSAHPIEFSSIFTFEAVWKSALQEVITGHNFEQIQVWANYNMMYSEVFSLLQTWLKAH